MDRGTFVGFCIDYKHAKQFLIELHTYMDRDGGIKIINKILDAIEEDINDIGLKYEDGKIIDTVNKTVVWHY